MLSPAQLASLPQPVRIMQVVGLSLVTTVIGFGTVACLLPKQPNAPPYTLSIAAAIAGVGALAFSIVAARFISQQSIRARERVDPDALSDLRQDGDLGPVAYLAGVYQTGFIVGVAMLEGAALFNLVVYMREAQWYSLAVAGVLLAGIVVSLPSTDRVAGWVEQKLRDARDTRR